MLVLSWLNASREIHTYIIHPEQISVWIQVDISNDEELNVRVEPLEEHSTPEHWGAEI